jgi:hypothetical protein
MPKKQYAVRRRGFQYHVVCLKKFPHGTFSRLATQYQTLTAVRARALKLGQGEEAAFADKKFMEQILSILYAVSGVAASALYVPQIIKYHCDRESRRSISLVSWGGWIAVASVTILYALYVVKSWLFAAVAGLNVAAQVTVLFYGLKARLNRQAAVALATPTGVGQPPGQ